LLLSISLWMYGATVGLLAFYLLLGWMGVGLGYGLFVIPGVVGMANWVVAIVGIGFCIANPRVRGLAIAAVCVAAVHLGLTFYDATDRSTTTTTETTQSGNRTQTVTMTEQLGGRLHKLFAMMAVKGIGEEFQGKLKDLTERAQKNPRDFENLRKEQEALFKEIEEAAKSWKDPSLYWEDYVTMLPLFDGLFDEIVYDSKHLGGHAVSLLAGAFELARLILILLLVGAVARAGRAGDAAGKSKAALVGVSIAAGACLIVSFVVSLIVHEGKPSLKTLYHLGVVVLLLLYLTHAAMALVSALVAQIAKNDVR
jgi:hypothetical protein